MKKDVIISLKGTQINNSENASVMELVTLGKYYRKGNTYYVTYKESEVTGMDGTTTTLEISGEMITLMRSGTTNSQFIFERGIRHFSHYDTIFGSFTVGVFANDVSVNINEKGGEIVVGYQIDMGSDSYGYNDFRMMIREAGKNGIELLEYDGNSERQDKRTH